MDVIPEDKGCLPHLTPRQFRRTLAWFLACRPGGNIADTLQYRHQRIQMSEGYVGTKPKKHSPAASSLSRLRKENTDLCRTLALYEGAIRQPALESDALRSGGRWAWRAANGR